MNTCLSIYFLRSALIIAFENSGGWSEKLAGTKLDDTDRYPDIPEDKVYGVTTSEEAIKILNENIDRYTTRHTSITVQDLK